MDNDAVQQEADELQGRNRGCRRVGNRADVRRAEGAGLDEDEEAADGQQKGRKDVAGGAVEDEAVDAVELGARAGVIAPGGVLSLAGVADAVVEGGDEREERLCWSVLFASRAGDVVGTNAEGALHSTCFMTR